MSTKIYISGNFLIAEDAISKDIFFKINKKNVHHLRSDSDNFAFFQEGLLNNVNGEPQTLGLGVRQAWEWDTDQLEQPSKTGFEFSEIVDETGTPYATADALDNFLNENLGASDVNVDISGFLTSVAHDATMTGDGTSSSPLSVVPQQASIGNYAQTVQGPTINTIGEQSIIGSGVGSLSIPANGFVIGDSFHGKIGGLINATGGGGRSEIIINIRSNGTILATTGSFDLDNATNQGWEMELDFTIRSIGTTGIICTNGNFVYTKDNNRSVFGYIFQDNKTIDTTANNTLDVTVEWRVLNAGDDIYSANFVLYKVF